MSDPQASHGKDATMTATVEFHFDFGSPNAYLAHRVIPAIEARTGASFRYVPVLLGGVFKATGNRSPGEAFAGIRNKPEYERLETERFLRRHGISGFVRNPFFPVNTLRIMRGAVAAEMDGTLAPYVAAVFHHMWEQPKKMDEPDVIRAALDESGLDGAAMLARIEDAVVKQRLIDNTESSVARGAFGSPTFFVGSEIWFGKDRLRDVEEAVAAASLPA
jgi:2-hydroxychromene-2-carboxylate isomerase